MKVDLFDSLPLEKTITFHNLIKLIKSVFNKDKNNSYYNIFLEKTLYELSVKHLFVWNANSILWYDKIYVSEGIEVNQTSESKECNIYHY